ncbi:hypothetical protein [Methanosphaerula palustris]|uniref:hypothetical protein n=1 Tax=Methanosphaerula palustris TaxID=475088 RepID=UPI0001848F42|nr:hypothetical protein [Methanosphaerula palustris]
MTTAEMVGDSKICLEVPLQIGDLDLRVDSTVHRQAPLSCLNEPCSASVVSASYYIHGQGTPLSS